VSIKKRSISIGSAQFLEVFGPIRARAASDIYLAWQALVAVALDLLPTVM